MATFPMTAITPITRATSELKSGTVDRQTLLYLLGSGVSCGVYENEESEQFGGFDYDLFWQL